jgi:hypothetical protein
MSEFLPDADNALILISLASLFLLDFAPESVKFRARKCEASRPKV